LFRPGAPETKRDIEWLSLPDDEDYLMKPVLEGLCSYSELKDCTLDMADLARMNDAITIKYENERRFRKSSE